MADLAAAWQAEKWFTVLDHKQLYVCISNNEAIVIGLLLGRALDLYILTTLSCGNS
jgi:hypothetical protein